MKTITIGIGDFVWMLGFMPYEEAKKMLDRHPIQKIEYCGLCGEFRLPHEHGKREKK